MLTIMNLALTETCKYFGGAVVENELCLAGFLSVTRFAVSTTVASSFYVL